MARTFQVTPAFDMPDEIKDMRWEINPLQVTMVRPVVYQHSDGSREVQTEILFANTVSASSSLRVKESLKKVTEYVNASLGS